MGPPMGCQGKEGEVKGIPFCPLKIGPLPKRRVSLGRGSSLHAREGSRHRIARDTLADLDNLILQDPTGGLDPDRLIHPFSNEALSQWGLNRDLSILRV